MASLEPLGVTDPDGRLYESVVAHPGTTVEDAGAHAQLSTTQARQGLSRLIALGLISRSPGRQARYSPTPPDSALTALVHQREEELADARNTVRKLAALYEKSAQSQQQAGLIEVVAGREAITRISWQVIIGAKEQIRWFDRPPYPNDPPNALLGAERAALSHGVSVRMVFASAGVARPGRLDEMQAMVRLGEQIRVLPDLPVKMGIVDDRLAILPVITPSHINDAAYLLHPSSLLDALTALFEDHWSHALPLANATSPTPRAGRQAHTSADEVPSNETLRLLALLAAGLTDDAIARATGAGLRTVQRRIHDLMDRLHVRTRFQAGIAARDSGWLPAPDSESCKDDRPLHPTTARQPTNDVGGSAPGSPTRPSPGSTSQLPRRSQSSASRNSPGAYA